MVARLSERGWRHDESGILIENRGMARYRAASFMEIPCLIPFEMGLALLKAIVFVFQFSKYIWEILLWLILYLLSLFYGPHFIYFIRLFIVTGHFYARLVFCVFSVFEPVNAH